MAVASVLYLSVRPSKVISPDMKSFLIEHLKKKAVVALVGGSDLAKMQEQMGGDDGEQHTWHTMVVRTQTDRHNHTVQLQRSSMHTAHAHSVKLLMLAHLHCVGVWACGVGCPYICMPTVQPLQCPGRIQHLSMRI